MGAHCQSTRVNGYKRHLLRDLDSGLVPVVGVTPANAPEASVTDALEQDLQAQQRTLSELHIDARLPQQQVGQRPHRRLDDLLQSLERSTSL